MKIKVACAKHWYWTERVDTPTAGSPYGYCPLDGAFAMVEDVGDRTFIAEEDLPRWYEEATEQADRNRAAFFSRH